MNRVSRIITLAIAACALVAPAAAKKVPQPVADAPIAETRAYFTEDPDAPMIAPAGYDVTIVEYLDYQCAACRASYAPLSQLLAKDKKVRVIFRDWPIFGAMSERAALWAVASKYQNKYVAFHGALFEAARPLDGAKIEAAAKTAGVDVAQLRKDIIAHSEDIEDLLARNDEQAQLLGLDGTPGFIVGSVQSFGGMTLAQFEESVADARAASGKAATERGRR